MKRQDNRPKDPRSKQAKPKDTPIDISTGKPKRKAANTASEITGSSPQQPDFDPEKQRALELIALGSSVTGAMEAIGKSRSCFYKWGKADPSFEHYGQRARGIHIADIDDALHELDTDARALVHKIVIDENISPGIRLRAALSALTRRGPGWLPRELPPYEYGPQSPTNPGASRSSTPHPAGEPMPTPSNQESTRPSPSSVPMNPSSGSPASNPCCDDSATDRSTNGGAPHPPSGITTSQPCSDRRPVSPLSVHSGVPPHDSDDTSNPNCESSASAQGSNGRPSHRCQDGSTSRPYPERKRGVNSETQASAEAPVASQAGIITPEQQQPAPQAKAEVQKDQPSEARPSQPQGTRNQPGYPITENAKSVESVESPTPAPSPIQLIAHQQLPPAVTNTSTPAATIKSVESVDNANRHITAQASGDIPDLPRQSHSDPAGFEASDIHPQDIDPPNLGLHDVEQPGITEQPTTTEQPTIATPTQRPLSSSEALPPQPEVAPPDASNPSSPPRGPHDDRRSPASLDHVFLSRYTIHRHESPADFQRLFREMVDTHQPQSRAEELTVLRIAQSLWQIRRMDAMEMAVSDSTVEQVRATAPSAHPAAALAAAFLTAKPTLQTLFFDRLRNYRRTHEETLDRLENRLLRQQSHRQASALRATKHKILRASVKHPNQRVLVRETRFESRINQNFRESLLPLATGKPFH